MPEKQISITHRFWAAMVRVVPEWLQQNRGYQGGQARPTDSCSLTDLLATTAREVAYDFGVDVGKNDIVEFGRKGKVTIIKNVTPDE